MSRFDQDIPCCVTFTQITKTQKKSQHMRNNMIQVPKNNKFRKTRSRLGQENLKKEVEPIAPKTRKLSHKQKYTRACIEVPIQVQN